jgi:hypothetical protein
MITFFDPRKRSIRPVLSSPTGGIAICGSKVLSCGDYGDCLVPIDLKDSKGHLSLDLKGVLCLGQRYYELDSFHGQMIGSGRDAVLINEAMTNVWVDDIDTIGDQTNLEQNFFMRRR